MPRRRFIAAAAAGSLVADASRATPAALLNAARAGDTATLIQLLDAGTPVDSRDAQRRTALLEAIILGDGGGAHTEIVRLLLAAGARPDLPDGQGTTPLAHAEQRGQRAIAGMLRAALAKR